MSNPLRVLSCLLLLWASMAGASSVRYAAPGADHTLMPAYNEIDVDDDGVLLTADLRIGPAWHGVIARLSADGAVLAERVLGEDGMTPMGLSDRTTDGGRIVALAAGAASSLVGWGTRVSLLKLDVALDEAWRLELSSDDQQRERPVAFAQDPVDGSLYLATMHAASSELVFEADLRVYKLSSTGQLLWTKTLVQPGYDRPQLLFRPAASGKLIIKGYGYETRESNEAHCRVVALDAATGELVWDRRPRIDGADVYCFATRLDSAHRLSMLSEHQSDTGYLPLAVDDDGNVSYGNMLSTPPGFRPEASTLTPEGQLLVIGGARLGAAHDELVVVRVDADRQSLGWHRMQSLLSLLHGPLRHLRITSNGSQIVVSFESPPYLLVPPTLTIEMHSMTGRFLGGAALLPNLSMRSPTLYVSTGIAGNRFVLARDQDGPPAEIELVSLPLAPFDDGFE